MAGLPANSGSGDTGDAGTATIAHVDARLAKRRSRSGVNPSMSCGEASLSRPSASLALISFANYDA